MTGRRREGHRWTMLAEDHRSGAFEHKEARWGAPEEDEAFALDTDPEESPHELDENFDNLVARYFGDVRPFPLLSGPEEQTLWCRLESAQKRERRVIYTASMALPILTQLWHQVEREELPLARVLHDAEALATRQGDLRRQLGDAMLELQDISTRLQALRPWGGTAAQTAAKCRIMRRTYVALGRQSCKTWDALAVHRQVYD